MLRCLHISTPSASDAPARGLAYKYLYHVTNPHHCFVGCGKYVLQLEIPPPPPVVKKGALEVKLPCQVHAGHAVETDGVRLTPGGDWLLAFGADGYVSWRRVEAMMEAAAAAEGAGGGGRIGGGAHAAYRPHDFRRGSVIDVCATPDGRWAYTVGADGVLTAYRCHGGGGGGAAGVVVEAAFSAAEGDKLARLREASKRPVSGRAESGRSSDSAVVIAYSPEEEMTWIEEKKANAIKEEDKLYAQQKTTLRKEIEDVKRQLKVRREGRRDERE